MLIFTSHRTRCHLTFLITFRIAIIAVQHPCLRLLDEPMLHMPQICQVSLGSSWIFMGVPIWAIHKPKNIKKPSLFCQEVHGFAVQATDFSENVRSSLRFCSR
jgi:hypothetical protein